MKIDIEPEDRPQTRAVIGRTAHRLDHRSVTFRSARSAADLVIRDPGVTRPTSNTAEAGAHPLARKPPEKVSAGGILGGVLAEVTLMTTS
jgi:hypothetical protein